MSTYVSGGTRLNFVESGEGVPVVFLHPTPLDHDFWRPMAAQLDGVRAITPDLRGHGSSELGSGLPVGTFERVPDAPVLTMQQLAADTLALLDHLSMQQAVFAGCSIGGYVLLELWRQAPERVRGLAFVCSKPQRDPEPALVRRAETIARARAQGAGALFDGMAQSLTGSTAKKARPEIVGELRSRMTLTTETLVAVQAGLATRPDSLATVATIRVPVLAIAGGEDGSVSPHEMDAFRNAPGGCVFHLLPEAGHLAAYEYPKTLAELIGPWVRHFGI